MKPTEGQHHPQTGTAEARCDVAIVGGGLAGLTAARALQAAGYSVRVFDKGRGAGGRASTRREGEQRFDHGAQYFTARAPEFRKEVETWLERGVAAKWTGRVVELSSSGAITPKGPQPTRHVGTPGMNAIVKALAEELPVDFGVRIARLEKSTPHWRLFDDHLSFVAAAEHVLVTLPPEQAHALLVDGGSALADRISSVRSEPCWAVLVALPATLQVPLDGAFVADSPLAWVARDSSKPQRSAGERWVLHASEEWSTQNLEASADDVARELLREFYRVTGERPQAPDLLRAHRWRYAKAHNPLSVECLWDKAARLGVGGDWCHGCRIEGAFLSGSALARQVLRTSTPPA